MSRFSEYREFPKYLVKLASGGPRVFPAGRFRFSVTGSLVFVKYLGVFAKLAAWVNPPNPTLVVWVDSV